MCVCVCVYLERERDKGRNVCITYTHTHTHTHIYIYIYICLHLSEYMPNYLPCYVNLGIVYYSFKIRNGWLVGLVDCVLWHINLWRLFNAKSILCKKSVLFQTIQFAMSTQFNCQKHFYFRFSVSTVSMLKTVPFETIHSSISSQCKCKYRLIIKNIFILSYSV